VQRGAAAFSCLRAVAIWHGQASDVKAEATYDPPGEQTLLDSGARWCNEGRPGPRGRTDDWAFGRVVMKRRPSSHHGCRETDLQQKRHALTHSEQVNFASPPSQRRDGVVWWVAKETHTHTHTHELSAEKKQLVTGGLERQIACTSVSTWTAPAAPRARACADRRSSATPGRPPGAA